MNSIIVGPLLKDPKIILDYIEKDTKIIACDRGTNHLFELDLEAELYIGDFDSIDPNLFAKIPKNKLKKFPSEKDTTDFELALNEALDEVDTKKVYGFGFLGGRLDHELGNVFLLPRMRARGLEVVLVDDQNEIHYLEEEAATIQTDKKYISFIPLENTVITLKNFKYSVNREEIPKYSTQGLSNELCIEKDIGEITLHEGAGFLIFSEDKLGEI